MANANITTIITSLAVIPADTTATDSFQDDVIYELARGVYPDVLAQVGASFIAAVAGTERYLIPTASNARTPLALFYGDTQLLQLRKQEAWAYDQAWRNAPLPSVIGYTYDPEDRVAFSLVPPPFRSGGAIGGNTPTNVTAWPDGNITIIYATSDTAFAGTTYDDLKLPIALEVLAREFGRDSDHQDLAFAQYCHGLSGFFFLMFNPVGRPM